MGAKDTETPAVGGLHPDAFRRRPHRTLLGLSIPVFLALVAEPLTGLVDTYFVSRIDAHALAALGVATILLSSAFWVFNFLAIGTQTEIARALGASQLGEAREIAGVALTLALALGALLALILWPCLGTLCQLMGSVDATHTAAVDYLQIRLLGIPASLCLQASFGALRGLQDMRTPLLVSLVMHGCNILLDAVWINGWGPFPALGVQGAAWASTVAMNLGAALAVARVLARLGKPTSLDLRRVMTLFVVGRDLILRTGALMLFLVLATERATRVGAEAGAAHQVIRQVWFFTALALDAFATTAQSLVGFFLGRKEVVEARRVARITCLWGVAFGVSLTLAMIAGTGWVQRLLVPATAQVWFSHGWIAAALAQPLNALSFVTDGIHWATRDYRFLRNGMLAATLLGVLLLYAVPAEQGLQAIWWVTGFWILLRALFGALRIWPGIGRAPLVG